MCRPSENGCLGIGGISLQFRALAELIEGILVQFPAPMSGGSETGDLVPSSDFQEYLTHLHVYMHTVNLLKKKPNK